MTEHNQPAGEAEAREVLASFGDKHFATNIIKYADDDRVTVRASVAIAAMLAFRPTPAASVAEDQIRIAAWNAAKKSGASDVLGYAVVDAMITELRALPDTASGGGEG